MNPSLFAPALQAAFRFIYEGLIEATGD